MTSQYSKNFKNTYPDKQILTKGKPTKFFVEFYLAACNDKEEKALLNNIDKFPKPLQELIRKDSNVKGNIPSEELISQYIEKNAELIAEKDTLFKKVQELQQERDKLKEQAQKVVNGIEVMEYNQIEHELLCLMIEIFKENKIKTDKLTYAQIEFINKTYKELSSK